jgi:hypothetical protein
MGYGTRWTTTETDGTERANSPVLEKAPSDHRACVCGLWSKEKIHSPRFRFISLRLVKKELARPPKPLRPFPRLQFCQGGEMLRSTRASNGGGGCGFGWEIQGNDSTKTETGRSVTPPLSALTGILVNLSGRNGIVPVALSIFCYTTAPPQNAVTMQNPAPNRQGQPSWLFAPSKNAWRKPGFVLFGKARGRGILYVRHLWDRRNRDWRVAALLHCI